MKVAVTGLRGIPGVMGGVETHCEEIAMAIRGFLPRTRQKDNGMPRLLSLNVKLPREIAVERAAHGSRPVRSRRRGETT